MSSGARLYYGEAMKAVESVMGVIGPECERLEIAGSLRRKCRDVGDLELVGILNSIPDLFGYEHRTSIWVCEKLTRSGYKVTTSGNKYVMFEVPVRGGTSEIHCDLFLTTPAKFGVISAIRTGPADFSHRLVTSVEYGGMMPIGMRIDQGYLWQDDVIIPTPSDYALFRAMGVAWIEPEDRR